MLAIEAHELPLLLMLLLVMAAAAAVLLFPFWAPLLVKAKMKMRLEGVLRESEDEDLSADDRAFFVALEDALADAGYVAVGSFALEGMVPMVRMHFIMLLNPESPAMAMGSVTRTIQAQGKPQPAKQAIEFASELDDGQNLNTNNNLDSVSPDNNPDKQTWVFPEEKNPLTLLKLHEAITREFAAGTPFRPVPMQDSPARFLLDEIRREMDKKTQRGFWSKTADGYTMTLKGAYLNTWGELPPFKHFRRDVIRKRSNAMRAKVGL